MNREVIVALAIAGALSVGSVWAIASTVEPSANAAALGANGLPSLETLAGPALEGTTDVGATTTEVLVMNETGLVNVTFTLRWTAGAGSSTMQLAIAPSNATGLTEGATSEAEDDGEISLMVAIPNTAAAGELGVGEWEAQVTFVEANTGTPVPAGAVPTMSDGSVAWTLETTLQAHAS